MGILVEWNFTGGLALIDGSLPLVSGSLPLVGGDVISRISYQSPQLAGKWRPRITGFSPIIRKNDEYYGGYNRFDFGEIAIALDHFSDADDWPPRLKASMRAWYTPDTEANRELFFDGVVHRTAFSPYEGTATYALKSAKYGAQVLVERENHDGDVAPMPRAFGAVTHEETVRLPDSGSGRQSYWRCHLAGTVGVDWHVFDDGVDIDSKVVISSDPYVFDLFSPPVGRVTVSGTGDAESLVEVFDWACTGSDDKGGKLLDLTLDSTLAASHDLAWMQRSQVNLIDWLSGVAAFFTHYFYIEDNTLVLADLAEDNGSSTLGIADYTDVSVSDLSRVSGLRAKWTVYSAVEETIGKYVKAEDKEVRIPTIYTAGDEKNIDVYSTDKAVVESQLAAIAEILNGHWIQIRRPLSGAFPDPGKKYTISETRGPRDTLIVMRSRELRYDLFGNKPMVTISGNGTLT